MGLIKRVGYALPYPFRHPRLWLRGRKNAVKWFIQRGRRGYSDYDLYSFDSYLIPMLIEVLPKYTNQGEFGKTITFHDPEMPRTDLIDPKSMESWDMKVLAAVSYIEEWWERSQDDVLFDEPLDMSQIEYVFRHIRCFWW